jgi:nitrite transporter NirC
VPVSVTDALQEQVATAQAKAAAARRPGGYLVSAMLAGAYVGVGVVLMIAVTGPLQASLSPWVKLIQGLVFGIALTLVVFAGAELSNGNMMTMAQGAFTRRNGLVTPRHRGDPVLLRRQPCRLGRFLVARP